MWKEGEGLTPRRLHFSYRVFENYSNNKDILYKDRFLLIVFQKLNVLLCLIWPFRKALFHSSYLLESQGLWRHRYSPLRWLAGVPLVHPESAPTLTRDDLVLGRSLSRWHWISLPLSVPLGYSDMKSGKSKKAWLWQVASKHLTGLSRCQITCFLCWTPVLWEATEEKDPLLLS